LSTGFTRDVLLGRLSFHFPSELVQCVGKVLQPLNVCIEVSEKVVGIRADPFDLRDTAKELLASRA